MGTSSYSFRNQSYVEIIVHHLLIGEITYLGRQDEFPMMSAIRYMMHQCMGCTLDKTYGES